MTIRVLIVEDHNLLRMGLISMIAGMRNYEVVGEASQGKEAIHQALTLLPDLILMDLSMPGMNGFDATIQIKRRLPNVRIIVLTIYQTDEFVREALLVGADGYVLKGASYEEFVFALDTVASGKKFICNDVSMQLAQTFLHPASAPPEKTAWEKLTERERSILKLIAEGYTNRAAGQFLCISSKTVEKHRASLMHKLELRNAAELILMAIDMGLVELPAIGTRRQHTIPGVAPARLPSTAIHASPAANADPRCRPGGLAAHHTELAAQGCLITGD